MELTMPLVDFPGIGGARERSLAKLGLTTAGDLLGYFPRDYEDRTRTYTIKEAPLGEPICVVATVGGTPRVSYIRKGLELVKAKAVDATETLTLTFFNQSYVQRALISGRTYVFYGKMDCSSGYFAMTNPAFEEVGQRRFTGRIMPIYPLTAGVSNNLLAGLTGRAVPQCAPQMVDQLPPYIREEHGLLDASTAYEDIHFPPDFEALERARRRLVFEELFTLTAGLALLRHRRDAGAGAQFVTADLDLFYDTLPFQLTGAQQRTIAEAAADCQSGRVMNRLVQGDVGSGKTVVAAAVGWLAHQSGYQTAMMAPTEILAEQHYRTMTALLEPSRMTVALLTGSMTAKEKRQVYGGLERGDIHFVVGTHALLSQGVAFQNLGLVVTDEQHRFGVNQRSALASKAGAGRMAHTLVMSATPIPRTLALMIYGDLEVSIIDELPPGRMPIKTGLMSSAKRAGMEDFVRQQVKEGRQVYVICPSVEENPDDQWDLKAVTAYAKELQTVTFPDLAVGFVHGKMKAKEKESIMSAFGRGEIAVLVATTVVEVGVDVPNASLIIIENADRYGLSQLHQLRGRVGRGKHQSWCILVSDNRNPETRQRLRALVESNDGFKIAETDLKLRGPGDFFGQRQHGLPTLRVASLNGDTRVLKEAQEAARALLERDPKLELPEHSGILNRVKTLFRENPDIFN